MTEYAQFSADDTAEDLKELIIKNCRNSTEGPCGDYDHETGKTNVRRRDQS